MSDERWLPIPGLSGYDISDQGRVRSWRKFNGDPGPRILNGSRDTSGYRQVCIWSAGTLSVHRLVLSVFVGPRPEGLQARHLDGNQLNNALSNLAYGTAVENAQDKLLNGPHHQSRKTHCPSGHAYDDINTYWHRNKRYCRTCVRAAKARHAERQKQLGSLVSAAGSRKRELAEAVA